MEKVIGRGFAERLKMRRESRTCEGQLCGQQCFHGFDPKIPALCGSASCRLDQARTVPLACTAV